MLPQITSLKVTDKHVTENRFFKFNEWLVSKEHPEIARQMDLTIDESYIIGWWCQQCGDPWRKAHPDNQVIISSGKRVPRLNDLVGGSKTSDHLYCCAVDSSARGMSAREYFLSILDMRLPYRQLILYENFVHWSINIPSRSYKHQTLIKGS